MNAIHLAGQVITSTNYTAQRLFDFNPEPLKKAAQAFLACGITDIEIPEAVLDPNRQSEKGCDEATLRRTIAGLPPETRVVATYLNNAHLGPDNAAYLESKRRALDHLIRHFPDLRYAALHPPGKPYGDERSIRSVVETYARLARHAADRREGFQLFFHNHFDGGGETAGQVRHYLEAIGETGLPSLRWGPDTGHCHGLGGAYLEIFEEYAHLVGDFVHLKARVPAFDRLHGGDAYRPDRDIWSNKAEIGGGLYSGFVNAADPEMETPFGEVFRILRAKARPANGRIWGAMEIDIPRQHPRLEILCGALYFKNVHGVEGTLALSNDEMIARVFGCEPATNA